jgi:hypothetical protein
MQMFPHFKNDETARVSLRLNKDEEMSLRLHMHFQDKKGEVCFPHGVRMFYRSMGWYRLDTSNNFRAAQKLKLAVSIVKSWYRKYDAARTEELRLLMLKAVPDLQVMSYSDGQYMIHNKKVNTVQTAAAAFVEVQAQEVLANKLAALAQRFAH